MTDTHTSSRFHWLIRKRHKPRSRIAQLLLPLRWVLYAMLASYCFVLLFPQTFFPYSIETSGLRLYSTEPLDPIAQTRLDEVHAQLRRSKLYDPHTNERTDLFLCNSEGLYRLFSPFHDGMYACARPMLGQVFLARADLKTNRTGSPDPAVSQRTFTAVVAHEQTHLLLYRHLGYWKHARLKRWLAEGYCEYVSQNVNLPDATGKRLLLDGATLDDPNFDYYTWEQMVRYLIEKKGLSFDEIHARQNDYDAIKQETIEWLRSAEKPRR